MAEQAAPPIRLSGFTFLRDARRLGYPFEESIRSVLPVCDEFVIALGAGQDDTRERLLAMNEPKLRIIDTVWNEAMRSRGFVYGQQKMIAHYCCNGQWAFYLEGDEVLHEQDLAGISAALDRYADDQNVEAFAFHYHHFFGSPDWLAVGPGWYRTAVRIIRNTCRAYSPDGLFFAVSDGNNKRLRYPRAVVLDETIYHYGHVRPAHMMQEKLAAVGKYWNDDHRFDRYRIDPRMLRRFEGSHPAVMQSWLADHADNDFGPDADHEPTSREKRLLLKMKLESWFGLDLSRRHYRRVGAGQGASPAAQAAQ